MYVYAGLQCQVERGAGGGGEGRGRGGRGAEGEGGREGGREREGERDYAGQRPAFLKERRGVCGARGARRRPPGPPSYRIEGGGEEVRQAHA